MTDISVVPIVRIHPLADVQTASIGAGTIIWQFAIVLDGAIIGTNCNINAHTFIESDVKLGNNVTVKCGVYLWDGMLVDDNVFIGPNVTFTNDVYPRSKQYPATFKGCILHQGCSIGANATVLGTVSVGRYALVGAGSVVTHDVPDHALVTGNPARITGWVSRLGTKLIQIDNNTYSDPQTGEFYRLLDNELLPAVSNMG